MGTTQQIARFIVGAKFEDIPKPAIELAKLCLLDGIGCALFGATKPVGKIITAVTVDFGGRPVAGVVGTSLRTNAANAALANGILCHSEDFDSSHDQQSALMPVVLGLGEELHLSGRDALLAYMVGVDVSANIRRYIGSDHPAKGWHGTSSTGTLGSAAVAAKLLKLDELKTCMALGLGASQCAGVRAHHGTMGKPFHAGNAARGGVLAGKMAQQGYEMHPGIMEHRFGYVAVYGEQMAQLGNMTRHLGSPWVLMGNGRDTAKGSGIKVWPCCSGSHGAITAAVHLQRKHGFKAADVKAIDMITTSNPATMSSNIRWPETGLQGKFCTWYNVASAIVDNGRLDVTSFTDEAVKRSDVQALMKKISITQDREMTGRPGRSSGGESWIDMTVILTNGESHHIRIEGVGDRWGWDDRELVQEKFRSLASKVLKPAQVDAALNAILGMDQAADIGAVVETITLKR
jgi:2-methylcitrate dehydratase PrpD